jgi:hypothetical protein
MSTHDEQRAAEIEATHRCTRRAGRLVCGACGQSWPCTDYAWAVGEATGWTVGDVVRVFAAALIAVVALPAVTYHLLPTWAWLLLLVLAPFTFLGILVLASRRRP